MDIFVHSVQKIPDLTSFIAIPAKYGQMGCQLFFVLSGLTVSMSWNANYADNGKFSGKALLSFYKRRVGVIAPGVYVAIIFWLLYAVFRKMVFGVAFRRYYLLAIIENMLFLNGLIPYGNNWVYPGAWYIGTTMVFYAILPFIWKFICRYQKKIGFSRMVMIIAIGYFIVWFLMVCGLSVFGVFIGNNSFLYFSILNQMPVLFCGIILYGYFSEGRKVKSRIALPLMIAFFMIDIIIFYTELNYAIVPTLAGIAFMLLVVLAEDAYYKIPMRVRNFFEKLGKRSFYMFLVHTIFAWYIPEYLLAILNKLGWSISGTILYLIIIIPIYVFSYLTAGLMEKLVEKLKCFGGTISNRFVVGDK